MTKKLKDTAPLWDSPARDAYMLVHGTGSDTRGGLYGPPWEDYALTTDIYSRLTGIELSPTEGVLFMISMKLSRLSYGLAQDFPPELLRDSVVDAIGYMDCLYGVMLNAPRADEDDTDDGDDDDDSD